MAARRQSLAARCSFPRPPADSRSPASARRQYASGGRACPQTVCGRRAAGRPSSCLAHVELQAAQRHVASRPDVALIVGAQLARPPPPAAPERRLLKVAPLELSGAAQTPLGARDAQLDGRPCLRQLSTPPRLRSARINTELVGGASAGPQLRLSCALAAPRLIDLAAGCFSPGGQIMICQPGRAAGTAQLGCAN